MTLSDPQPPIYGRPVATSPVLCAVCGAAVDYAQRQARDLVGAADTEDFDTIFARLEDEIERLGRVRERLQQYAEVRNGLGR